MEGVEGVGAVADVGERGVTGMEALEAIPVPCQQSSFSAKNDWLVVPRKPTKGLC